MDKRVGARFVRQGSAVRAIPMVAEQQCGVFTAQQAAADGWTRSALQHALRTGRLVRLRAGAYRDIADGHLDEFDRVRQRHAAPAIAAVLTTPGAMASQSTAAVLRGLPLLFVPDVPCVTVVPWHTGEIARVHVHRCTSAPMVMPVGRVECTGVERTALDLAREHGVIAGVVALDHVLHEELSSCARLQDELTRLHRWPGVKRARDALAAADALSESPLETRSRLKFGDVGIPAPELQIRIGDHGGRFIARVDFFWPEYGVVGEADGSVKYAGEEVTPLHVEKARQEAVEQTGLIVVRWGARDLRGFEGVADRLRRAFVRGSRLPAPERRWTVLPRTRPAL